MIKPWNPEHMLSHVDPAESWGSKGLTQTCWCSMMSGQGLQPEVAEDFQHMKNAVHFEACCTLIIFMSSVLEHVTADVWHTWRKLKKIEQHEKGIKREPLALANAEWPRHRWSRGCKRQERQTTCRLYASLKLPPEYASSASQQSGTGSKSNLDISDAKMSTSEMQTSLLPFESKAASKSIWCSSSKLSVTGKPSELTSYFRTSSMPPVSYLRQTCKKNSQINANIR